MGTGEVSLGAPGALLPAPNLHRAGKEGILPFLCVYLFIWDLALTEIQCQNGFCLRQNLKQKAFGFYQTNKNPRAFWVLSASAGPCSLQEADLGAANAPSPSKMRVK